MNGDNVTYNELPILVNGVLRHSFLPPFGLSWTVVRGIWIDYLVHKSHKFRLLLSRLHDGRGIFALVKICFPHKQPGEVLAMVGQEAVMWAFRNDFTP
jgi:hypothetical protein